MGEIIRIAEDLLARLCRVDDAGRESPVRCIEKLLELYEAQHAVGAGTHIRGGAWHEPGCPDGVRGRRLMARATRETGVTVELGGHVIHAETVRDFYLKALKWLCDNGHLERLQHLIPYATSARRYLLAQRPEHPSGRQFFSAVEYQGYVMEAHKDYRTAILDLEAFAKQGGIQFKYRGL